MADLDEEFSMPSYLMAADSHNIANGNLSVGNTDLSYDPYNSESNWGKATAAVAIRAVTSGVDALLAPARWFGMEDATVDSARVIKAFDDDLSAYYNQNRESLDVVGDVAGMLIPGMAGVKLLNKAQTMLKGMEYAGVGSRQLKAFGALQDGTAVFAERAAASAANSGIYKAIDVNVMKALGSAYAQNVVEAAAFELAAISTMRESPLFENHDVSDIVYNSVLGGGLIGGGVLGTVTAVQTYGAISKARKAVDSALGKFRYTNEVEKGSDEWIALLNKKNELTTQPFAGEMGNLEQAAIRANEAKVRSIKQDIEKGFQKLTAGDRELSETLTQEFIRANPDDAFYNHAFMSEAGRVNSVLKADMRIESHLGKLAKGVKSENDDTVRFLSLWGDDAGIMSDSVISLPHLSDVLTLPELQNKVAQTASKIKPGEAWSPLGKSADEAELRYLAARKLELKEGAYVGGEDLPVLEAAYNAGLRQVNVDGVQLSRESLYAHIKQVKEENALAMIALEQIDPAYDPRIIARVLNVKEELLVAGIKKADDSGYFALTADNVDQFYKPSIAKVAYTGKTADLNVVDGMAYIRQNQIAQSQKIDKVLKETVGEDALSKLNIPIRDAEIMSASALGGGARVATFASGDYGTLASKTERIGQVTNQMKTSAKGIVQDTFNALLINAQKNATSANELVTAQALAHQTGMKYVLDSSKGYNRMVLEDVLKYEESILSGMPATKPALPAGMKEEFVFTQPESWALMEAHVAHNGDRLNKERSLMQASGRGRGDYSKYVYFPQPDSSKFSHFSFVVPKNPQTGQGTQMIWAKSADELANLESKVSSEFDIVRKSETERFFKLKGDYDSDLGMSSMQIRSDLQRTGAAGAYHPRTNYEEFMQDFMNFHYKQEDKLVRSAVELKFGKQMAELRKMDLQYKDLYSSTKMRGVKTSPYETYIRTMLDIPAEANIPVFSALNESVETITTKAWNALKGFNTKIKSESDLAELNKVLDRAGLKGYADAMTEAWASHPAGKNVASRFIQANNSALSLMVLGADPMNALNNGIGHSVLLWPETRRLLDSASELTGNPLFGKVEVPGTGQAVLSPSKLISQSYADYFKYLTNDPAMVARYAKFSDNGWMPSFVDQQRMIVEGASLTGKETAGKLEAGIKKVTDIAQEWLPKITGNKMAEEMNRFVAASVADSITRPLIAAGKMTEREADAYINTFVNRTQGNYLASQRPLMFQGPVGHAISLFQTYSFNLYQTLFRYVADGDKKAAATLLGLQTGIYGMNGLPMFNFMNEKLVGDAAGNRSHADVYSGVRDAAGDTMGNWLLYGSLSNATNLGLYSRGDLNPRHLTILPTSVADVPFVSAYTNVLGSMYNTAKQISAGGDAASTVLRGIEHAGLNRPLAGLATVMQGFNNPEGMYYSTTTGNTIVASKSHDLYDVSMWGRIAGARPMDEAMIRDAYFRMQKYSSDYGNKVKTMGSAIRDRVRNGEEVSQSEYEDFLGNYVKAGGDQKHFQKFWISQVKNAHTSQIEKTAMLGNTETSKYLQRMLGGVDLNEFTQE